MDCPQRRLERLQYPQAQAAAQRDGATLVWPFGACEQHGPHLPLITDALFAEINSRRIATRRVSSSRVASFAALPFSLWRNAMAARSCVTNRRVPSAVRTAK